MYIFVHNKQGRSKSNLLNLLKRRRTEANREVTQLLHITVAASYQDPTVRKFTITSQDPQEWIFGTRKYQKPFLAVLHVMISLILLPFAAPQLSRFYSFQGRMG